MRKKRKKAIQSDEKGALSLANEAVNLVRSVPTHVVASYFIGAVPFVIGLLFFWSDMSRSAFAHQRCLHASLGLTALFLWMKCWQAVYMRGLRAELNGSSPPAMTGHSLVRLVGAQLIIQPYGLITIPIAMAIGLPFYCVYGYYQNVTALGDGNHNGLKDLSLRAWRLARLWPRQGYVLLWLLCPWVLGLGMLLTFSMARFVIGQTPGMPALESVIWFFFALLLMYNFVFPFSPLGCILAGNVAIVIALLPHLLHSVLGIDTIFTLSGWHGIFNTTFIVTVYAIAFLCLDPVMKAAYALRCFYGESRQSGSDLRIELREFRNPAHVYGGRSE